MDAGAPEGVNRFALEERELETFERHVYSGRHEHAARQLLAFLDRVYQIFRAPGRAVAPAAERLLYTRLAAATAALIADPGFKLSGSGIAAFALHHSTLGFLFSAGDLRSPDHLAALVGERDAVVPAQLNYRSEESRQKLLLGCSLDSRLELDLRSMLADDPSRRLPFYLGMLNRYLFLTEAAERRRESLLAMHAIFERAQFDFRWLNALAVLWMNCMYATGEGKHGVKRTLNRLVAAQLETGAARAKPARRPLAERPVMLVPVEDLRTGHVNHRTFGPLLEELRERFTLVGAGSAGALDDDSKKIFDRVIEVAWPADAPGYAALLRQLSAIEADVVYYPTIGTHPWCIVTATQRLAPIQVATMGVPATTHSDAIDYVVIEESWAGDPACYSESVVHTRSGSTRFLPRSGTRVPRPSLEALRRPGAAVRVAVPALAPKLNAPFLETCARIAAGSRAPLEWHFFAGLSGLQHAVAVRQIREFIPQAHVHPHLDYDPYLQALQDCDLHLSSFPFGGMNTIFDSLHLGLPIVTLEGREPHARSDAGMMRRAGLPAGLIARSREAYAETALRLIEDASERRAVRKQLLATDLDAAFLSRGAAASGDYLRAFCWLYENHETLQASGKRWWSVADRDAGTRTNA